MSHELETYADGSTGFVAAREHAWHRLGIVLPGTFSAADAMRHAHLGGWNVRKETVQAVVLDAEGVHTLPVPGRFATVRTNPITGEPEALGVVGDGYVPIQNEEHCELLDALVDESGAHFETAGSLRGGRQVFLSMKLPHTITIGGVDPIHTYLAALNSHDGSLAFRLLVTPVRVVCANTQAAAIRCAKSSFSIHHTSGAHSHIHAAREALGLTFRFMDEFQAEADKMIEQAMTDAEFLAITRTLWPVAKDASTRTKNNDLRRESTLLKLFTESDSNAVIRGTRWAGYQAVTEYLDHHAPVDANRDADTVRAQRVVSGTVTNLKTRAFSLMSI